MWEAVALQHGRRVGGCLVLIAVYVPNAGAELGRLDYRVNRNAPQCWDRAFAEYIRLFGEAKSKPIVVIGDMNCAHRVQDIWNMYERPDFPDALAEKAVFDQYVGLTGLKKLPGLTPQ